MFQEGQRMPDFALPDSKGNSISSNDLLGKKVVLYFYPKDETAGCTIEACNFRDDFGEYARRGARVIGVSMDNQQSHQDFARKFALPFELLCDTDGTLGKLFGAYSEGVSSSGRPYKTLNRLTFVIDAQGIIRKVFANVNQNLFGHSQEVLEVLDRI
jgi:peroxiredoxin Q/BCP